MNTKIEKKISQAKKEFIFGLTDSDNKMVYPSLSSLVDKYKIPRATLYRRSKAENWIAQKTEHVSKLNEKISEERIKVMTKEAVKLDDRCIQLSQAMLSTVAKELGKLNSEDVRNIPNHLKELSNATINAQRIGKLALGEAQEISKVNTDDKPPESFTRIMEQLDEIAKHKAKVHNDTLQ